MLPICLHKDACNELYTVYRGAKINSVFQPIFNHDGEIFGYEALLRITNHNGEAVRPDLFFTSSEIPWEDKLNVELLSRELHLNNFAQSPYHNQHLFLNTHPDTSDYLNQQKLINDTSTVKNIVVEIVELETKCEEELTTTSRRLSSNGYKVAIDDYGSAYSDEKRVNAVSPHIIKFDRSLMTKYMRGNKAPLLKGLRLAKRIAAQTVVEGIESHFELDTMRKLGIDFFQGYYLAMPNKLAKLANVSMLPA